MERFTQMARRIKEQADEMMTSNLKEQATQTPIYANNEMN